MPCSKELAAICVITPIRKDNLQDNKTRAWQTWDWDRLLLLLVSSLRMQNARRRLNVISGRYLRIEG